MQQLSEKYYKAIAEADRLELINFVYEEEGKMFYVEMKKFGWAEPKEIMKL